MTQPPAVSSGGSSARSTEPERKTGIVLAGGGIRGAYETGVVAGILEVLGPPPDPKRPWFQVFVGTSVGAINAAFLAAHADEPDHGVGKLEQVWTGLRIEEMLRLSGFRSRWIDDPLGQTWNPGLLPMGTGPQRLGISLLDPGPLERLLDRVIPWARLRSHLDSGRVRALVVPALNIQDGRTTMFVDLAPGAEFKASKDPRRTVMRTVVAREHVMASASIPLVFPARRIHTEYFCDGGLRYNTAIAPAIRSGSDRLVLVGAGGTESDGAIPNPQAFSNPIYLAGKLLGALLTDPVVYDLQVLNRFNVVMKTLQEVLTPEEFDRLQKILQETRGDSYRYLETISFFPSRDLSAIAASALSERLAQKSLPWLTQTLLQLVVAGPGRGSEGDLASYILFDGALSARLIAAGRDDALQRANEIRAFFGLTTQERAA